MCAQMHHSTLEVCVYEGVGDGGSPFHTHYYRAYLVTTIGWVERRYSLVCVWGGGGGGEWCQGRTAGQ